MNLVPDPRFEHDPATIRRADLNIVERDAERCPAGVLHLDGPLVTVITTESGSPAAVAVGHSFAHHFRNWSPSTGIAVVELLRRIEAADLDPDSAIARQYAAVCDLLGQAVTQS